MSAGTDSIHTIVFEHSPEAIIVTDGDRVIQSVNPAFTTLFGYSQQEAAGLPMHRLYADRADYERIGREHAGREAKPPVRHYNIRYRRKDGSSFHAEATARRLADENGRYGGHVAIIRDVSARVKLKELLRSIVALSARNDDDTGGIVRQFLMLGCDYFGVETGAVSRVSDGVLVTEYLAGAARGRAEGRAVSAGRSCCEAVFTAKGEAGYAYPAYSEDGSDAALPCFAEEGAAAYIGCALEVAGKPYGTLSFFSAQPPQAPFSIDDRTLVTFLAEWLGGFLEQSRQKAELRRMSEDLQRSAETFQRLYRETPAMLHSIDPEGRLVEVSDYWLAKLGYESREEVIGRPVIDFHTPEDRLRVRRNISKFWRTGQPVRSRSYCFLRKDGTSFEAELSAIVAKPKGDAQPRSLAVSFDVTERNRARRELEIKNAELERLNEELETFASVASHDLQEPLRKIRAFAEILEEELPKALSDDGAYALGGMRAATMRMQTLVADLLAYAHAANAAISPEPVALEEVVRGVSEDLSLAIVEAKARISAAPLPTIRGDALQLRQLFQNLIGNAVKYRDHGRGCEIEIFAEPGEAAGGCRVSVRDNGIGFDPGAADIIFLPFRRLQPKSRLSGSGLGLTICGRIAERHGWSLRAQSAPGEGSIFTLEIPADSLCDGTQYLKEAGGGATGTGSTQSMV